MDQSIDANIVDVDSVKLELLKTRKTNIELQFMVLQHQMKELVPQIEYLEKSIAARKSPESSME